MNRNAGRTRLAIVAMVAIPLPSLAPASITDQPSGSVQCLAMAISYEAGNETIEGQEAVAHVILNRVRHPAYPKTVCGVIFQGSQRKTGCQFTFTCDGSLARPRSDMAMAQAIDVAQRVVDGKTSATVGGATHYHANYVSPYWAPSLIKVATIGAHIFYRMPGAPDFPASANLNETQANPEADTIARRQQGRRDATPVAITPAPPRSAVFAPWGLPTLVVSPNGKIKPTY